MLPYSTGEVCEILERLVSGHSHALSACGTEQGVCIRLQIQVLAVYQIQYLGAESVNVI